jgi:hypothetical protein
VRRQVERLGPERFMVVRFEEFCRDPRAFATAVGQRVLGEAPDFAATDPELAPFSTTPRRGTEDLLRRIRGTFSRMAGSE